MKSEALAWLIRRHGVEMTHVSGGSHIGPILSVADILGVLYGEVMNYKPEDPKWEDRDRFILSKGHAGAAIYATLAECGFFDKGELLTHYQNGSRLCGHVSHYLPGVEMSTGSLGHGLSAAAGMAIAAKQDGRTHKVYCVLGDGECNEGSVWEAAQAGAYFHLDNLVAVVDHNHMQSLDFCEKTLSVTPLADKWKAFGWNTIEVDGHNHEELKKALASIVPGKPTVVVAHTVKGYGVPFMEQDILWHYRFPHDGWEYDGAVTSLHTIKPEGAVDPYTPDGIEDPVQPDENADIYRDHTVWATFDPTWYHLEAEQ